MIRLGGMLTPRSGNNPNGARSDYVFGRCVECGDRRDTRTFDHAFRCVDVVACDNRIKMANAVGLLAPSQRYS